jgi:hypothetical protein
MYGTLAVGSSGFAASATGSAGSVSAGGTDCCDSPHPTSTTAAIVVIRRCFISLLLSILQPFAPHDFDFNLDISSSCAANLFSWSANRRNCIQHIPSCYGDEDYQLCHTESTWPGRWPRTSQKLEIRTGFGSL